MPLIWDLFSLTLSNQWLALCLAHSRSLPNVGSLSEWKDRFPRKLQNQGLTTNHTLWQVPDRPGTEGFAVNFQQTQQGWANSKTVARSLALLYKQLCGLGSKVNLPTLALYFPVVKELQTLSPNIYNRWKWNWDNRRKAGLDPNSPNCVSGFPPHQGPLETHSSVQFENQSGQVVIAHTF